MSLPWYRTGTVSVTNGSTTVTGTGTAWLTVGIGAGDLFVGPDGEIYEIVTVVGDTEIAIRLRNGSAYYGGSTANNAAYAIMKNVNATTNAQLAAQLSALLTKWQGREDEFAAWLSGSLTGGALNADGTGSGGPYYKMTAPSGAVTWVRSLPSLMALVDPIFSGVVTVAAGSAAAPAVVHSGDPNTGLYSAGADQLGVATGGVNRLTFDASGGLLLATTPLAADKNSKLAPTIWVKDRLREQLEGMTGGACTILYDSAGNPNYMRIIPAFRCEDISANLGTGTHPAFMVSGVFKREIFIGMYPAANVGGLGCSLPGVAPYTSINYDNAKAACTNKGAGWHLMTNWEWAALALWCIKNGTPLLRGNTYYGQSHASPFETGRRTDGLAPATASGSASILSGSGPVTWRHDNTMAGIADLVGNVWEWQDGLKVVGGIIRMPSDNHYTLAEASWPDTLVRIDASGSSSVISDAITARNTGLSNTWSATTTKSAYTPPVALKQALLCPYDSAANMGGVMGTLYANNSVDFEALPVRGGVWNNASTAGLAALYLVYARSNVSTVIGFRPAFIG